MHKINNKSNDFDYRLVLRKNIIKKRNAGWVVCDKNEFPDTGKSVSEIELVGNEWVSRSRGSVLMKISKADKKARDEAQEKKNKRLDAGSAGDMDKKSKETISQKLRNK